MQAFDRLVSLRDFDSALFENFSQFENEVEIDRQPALQTNKLDARRAKIRFQSPAAKGCESHLESVRRRIAANVQSLHFRAAALQGVECV